MSGAPPEVERHLAEFETSLRVGRRERRRLLAEIRDHLLCACEDRAAEHHGDRDAAARSAVQAMADPVTMASQFNAAAHERRTEMLRKAGAVSLVGLAASAAVALAAVHPKAQPQRTLAAAAHPPAPAAYHPGDTIWTGNVRNVRLADGSIGTVLESSSATRLHERRLRRSGTAVPAPAAYKPGDTVWSVDVENVVDPTTGAIRTRPAGS